MTLSREQSILAEVLARLNGTARGPHAKPANLTFERSRLREVAATQCPAGALYPLEATIERRGSTSECRLTVKIVGWVKGTAATPVDADLDAFALWVHQQLISDESLGGHSIRIDPIQKIWGFALHQAPFGDLDLHYVITFRHQSTDPARV